MASNYAQLRNERIKAQSLNPLGKDFPASVRAPSTLSKVANSEGNELHHNRIVDVFEQFFTGNQQEDLAMVDHLLQRGVPVGNNDLNFTAIPGADHQQGDNSIHRFAIENNIQANLKGMQNSQPDGLPTGTAFYYIKGVQNQVRNLPFNERMQALDIFIDQIQPALDEKMESMGYSQPSQRQVADKWRRDVDAEHDEIVSQYRAKQLRDQINPKGERFKQAYLDELLNKIRNKK